MKNITNLCIDLQEGKINRKDFLREARRVFPAYITNINTFEDTIKILKNKNLISEGCNCENQLEEIRPPESEEDEQDAFDSRINTSPIDNEYIGISNPEPAEPDEQDLEIMRNLDILDDEDNWENDLWGGEDDIDPAGGSGPSSHLEEEWESNVTKLPVRGITHDTDIDTNWQSTISEAKESKFKPMGSKYDGSDSEYNGTPDAYDPLEMQMGIRYEKSLDPNGTADKWLKKIKTNLNKNPYYYTNLSMAGYDEKKIPSEVKKRNDLSVEVTKTNNIDKANGTTSPKGIEKVKASANKAKKETFKAVSGVKDLTHKATRAKGIKGVMDMTGGKMKKVKALNELGINNPTIKPKNLEELGINEPVINSLQTLINTQFASEDIKLQSNDNEVLLKYNYWERLPENILSVLKSKYNVEGGDNNQKIYYKISPKITSEMMSEIKRRIKQLFKK